MTIFFSLLYGWELALREPNPYFGQFWNELCVQIDEFLVLTMMQMQFLHVSIVSRKIPWFE